MELVPPGAPAPDKAQSISFTWQRLSRKKRCYCVAVVLLILAILGMSIFLVASKKKEREIICLRKECPTSERENICLTRDCIESAQMISDSLDLGVNPCDNFYKFVCGGFLRRHSKVPDPDGFMWGSFMSLSNEAIISVRNMLEMKAVKTRSEAVRKMKVFYRSCKVSLSREGTSRATLMKEIERSGLGKWPDNLLNWKDSTFDLEDTLGTLFIHDIKEFIKAQEGEGGFVVRLAGLSDIDEPQMLEEYSSLMKSYFSLLDIPGSDAIISSILLFEKQLNGVLNNSKEAEDEEYHKPSELDRIYPTFNWTRLVQTIMWKAGFEPNADMVKLKAYHNFTELFSFLNSSSPRAIYNYLVWRFIKNSVSYLGPEFRRPQELATFRIKWDAEKGATYSPLWKTCVVSVSKQFPQALSAEYAKVMFSNAMYNELKSYLTAIKASFRRRLPLQSWLDQNAREEIEKKLNNISVVLAYPPSLMDIKSLDKSYEMVTLEEDSYLFNMLQLNKEKVRRNILSFLENKQYERFWSYNPIMVNAFNMVHKNHIVIPMGILYPPYFQINRQRYLNYAAIGSVLAHEMGHSFDNDGILISYTRNQSESKKWLGEEITQAFMDRAQCYVDQYSKYVFREHSENSTLNGIETLGDNIADNIGLWHSYLAYLEYEKKHGEEPGLPGLNFTNHQLFLIQNAQLECATYTPMGVELVYEDAHSPGEFRVIGTMVNMPDFGKIFDCPTGSPMNPYKKCKLWE